MDQDLGITLGRRPEPLHSRLEATLLSTVGTDNFLPLGTERFIVKPPPSSYQGEHDAEAWILVVPVSSGTKAIKVGATVVADLEIETAQQRLDILEVVNQTNAWLVAPRLTLRDSEKMMPRIEVTAGFMADEGMETMLQKILPEVAAYAQSYCRELIGKLGTGKTARQANILNLA